MSLSKFKARVRTEGLESICSHESTLQPSEMDPNQMNLFEKFEAIEDDENDIPEFKDVNIIPFLEDTPKETPPPMPQFVRIKENIYCTERSSAKEQKMRKMRCECVPQAQDEVGCLEGCFNRELFIECGPRCLYGDSCANKRFQNIENANVEAFFTGAKGWGLRACCHITSDTFIMEYVGEILGKSQFDKRTRRYAKDSSHKHHYFMSLKADSVIDATEKGSVSRFINHSCDPNCATQKWCVDGELRIGFFSIKDIALGEELTFDYRFQRYGREAQECYCGSANCRGFIGEQATNEEIIEDVEMQKEEKQRKKREKEMLHDKQLEKELADLFDKRALRNKADVLKCSRIMVRTGDFETQMNILQLIKNSDKPLHRLFLDLQGCQLLWIWTSSDDLFTHKEKLLLHQRIVQVLQLLPIPHRNMLEDSHVWRTIERWANPEKEKKSLCDVDEEVEACVRSLVSSVCAEEEEDSSSSSASPDQESSKDDEECTGLKENIIQASRQLLEQWEGLSKYFKIPKKATRSGVADRGRYCHDRMAVRESRFSTTVRRSTLAAPARSASSTLGAYYNKPSRKRVNGAESRFGSPSYVPSVNLACRKSASACELGNLMKPPPPPATPKQRVSRFDRKTPPHLMQEKTVAPAVLTKEEKRRAFELAVKATEKDNVKETMKLDFEIASAQIIGEDKSGGLYSTCVPPANDMYNPAHPTDTSYDPSEPTTTTSCDPAEPTQSPSTSYSEAAGITPVPNQPGLGLTSKTGARPAILVADSNTQSYWWQDQASSTLVYQVQPVQAAAVTRNDWSLRPWFQYEPESGLIHEVRVDTSEVLKESSPTVSTSQDNLPDDSYFGLPPGLPAAEVITLLKKQILDLRARLVSSEGDDKRAVSPARPASAMSVSDDDEDVATHSPPQHSTTSTEQLNISINLPPNWKVAYDNEQNPYYYNTITKETQWDPPIADEPSIAPAPVVEPVVSPVPVFNKGPKTPQSPSPKRRKLPRSNSGGRSAEVPVRVAADTSSVEMTEKEASKIREKFKADVSALVVKTLSHYRKDARFKTEADFKHLARKISHGVMEKEMKQKSVEMLVMSESVAHKAKHYIKIYMKKVGKVYSRPDRNNTSITWAPSESANSPSPQQIPSSSVA